MAQGNYHAPAVSKFLSSSCPQEGRRRPNSSCGIPSIRGNVHIASLDLEHSKSTHNPTKGLRASSHDPVGWERAMVMAASTSRSSVTFFHLYSHAIENYCACSTRSPNIICNRGFQNPTLSAISNTADGFTQPLTVAGESEQLPSGSSCNRKNRRLEPRLDCSGGRARGAHGSGGRARSAHEKRVAAHRPARPVRVWKQALVVVARTAPSHSGSLLEAVVAEQGARVAAESSPAPSVTRVHCARVVHNDGPHRRPGRRR